jgi:hypothetical protein
LFFTFQNGFLLWRPCAHGELHDEMFFLRISFFCLLFRKLACFGDPVLMESCIFLQGGGGLVSPTKEGSSFDPSFVMPTCVCMYVFMYVYTYAGMYLYVCVYVCISVDHSFDPYFVMLTSEAIGSPPSDCECVCRVAACACECTCECLYI